MTRDFLLPVSAGLLAVALTWLAIEIPLIAAIGAVLLAVTVVIAKIGDWWRRVYVVTIGSMFVGASHFEALTTVGTLLKTAMLLILAITTLGTSAGKHSIFVNKLHAFTTGLLWAIAGWALLSTIWSTERTETIVQSLSFLAFVFIVHKVSTTRWTNRQTMTADMVAAYWASFSMLAIGAVLSVAGIDGAVSSYSGRHLGLLNNPNLLGLVAAVTFAVGLGVAAHKRSPLVAVSLLIPLSQVLLSQSRTAILATSIAIVWVLLRSGIVKALIGLFLVVTGAIAAAAFRFNPFGESLTRFDEYGAGGLLNYRTSAWSDVFDYLRSNPLGAGWGTTNTTLNDLTAQGISAGLSSIHNSYLQLMFELGWVGAVPAVLIVGILVAITLRAPIKGLNAGLVGVTVIGAIIQVTESTMFGTGQPYPYLFWFAVLAAVITMTDGSPRPQKVPAAKQKRRVKKVNTARQKVLAAR